MAYKDPEKERAALRARRAKNPEKHRAENRAWWAKNLEKARAAKRALWAKNPEKHRAASRVWRAENPEKAREGARRSKYSGNIPDNTECAVCGIYLTKPHTDHDHTCCNRAESCGKCVRANLCSKCNMNVVGGIESFCAKAGLDVAYLPQPPDPILRKAYAYILKWRIIHAAKKGEALRSQLGALGLGP